MGNEIGMENRTLKHYGRGTRAIINDKKLNPIPVLERNWLFYSVFPTIRLRLGSRVLWNTQKQVSQHRDGYGTLPGTTEDKRNRSRDLTFVHLVWNEVWSNSFVQVGVRVKFG